MKFLLLLGLLFELAHCQGIRYILGFAPPSSFQVAEMRCCHGACLYDGVPYKISQLLYLDLPRELREQLSPINFFDICPFFAAIVDIPLEHLNPTLSELSANSSINFIASSDPSLKAIPKSLWEFPTIAHHSAARSGQKQTPIIYGFNESLKTHRNGADVRILRKNK